MNAGAGHRPSVYQYDDYKKYLKDMLFFLRQKNSRVSLREISRRASISNGYLSLILNSEKHLAEKTLEKIIPALSLNSAEASYLKVLRSMSDPKGRRRKTSLLARYKRFRKTLKSEGPDRDMVSYLSRWYHIAIRELASIPGFRLDPNWIRKRLSFPVNTRDIDRGIKLLVEKGFLFEKDDKSVQPAQKRIRAQDQIYSVALTHLHEQFLDLAIEAMNRFALQERCMKAHIVALDDENIQKAREILDQAIESIARLENKSSQGARAYYFGLLGYPLTNVDNGDKE